MTVELLLVLGDGGLLTGRRCGILPMGVVESLNGHFYREAQLVDLPAACLGALPLPGRLLDKGAALIEAWEGSPPQKHSKQRKMIRHPCLKTRRPAPHTPGTVWRRAHLYILCREVKTVSFFSIFISAGMIWV